MSKVTVVGAGKYGSTTVQRLAEADVADELVMTDIFEGLPPPPVRATQLPRSLRGDSMPRRAVANDSGGSHAGSAADR